LSILFRTKGWLTLAQLLPAWASELADGKKDADQISRMNCRPHHSRARRRHRKSLGRTKDLRESKTPNELAGEQEAGDAEERSHALRQVRLLAQSREAARLDPRARRYAALGLIRASLPSTTCTVSEIFGATYGDPQGFDYWDAWLSEPLPIHTFIPPDQATEPNVNLCRRVSAKLNEAKLPNVSDDTILRAAGRRKERK
jgi:hypothetical protein